MRSRVLWSLQATRHYVVNCFKQRWYVGWQRRNWRNSQGAPVANQDLWEPCLIALALDTVQRSVRFRKVLRALGRPDERSGAIRLAGRGRDDRRGAVGLGRSGPTRSLGLGTRQGLAVACATCN